MTYLINDWIDESLLYFCFRCVKPLYLMLLFCVVSFHRATGAIFRSLDHFLCLNMHKKSKSKLNSIRMVNKNHAKKYGKHVIFCLFLLLLLLRVVCVVFCLCVIVVVMLLRLYIWKCVNVGSQNTKRFSYNFANREQVANWIDWVCCGVFVWRKNVIEWMGRNKFYKSRSYDLMQQATPEEHNKSNPK